MKTYISPRDWLEIFPDAKDSIKNLIAEKIEEATNLSKEIYDDLNAVNKLDSDEFSKWFAKETILTWKEPRIKELTKDIRRLKSSIETTNKADGRITPEEIERAMAYDWNLLLEIKGDYAHCPFHEDKTASFHLIKSTNHAYCFSCNWKGNIIKFIMDRDNIGFREAIKKLI